MHCHIVIIVLMSLGWSIKWAKCDLVPKQNIRHLGFDFNTNEMTISCPPEKITNLQDMCLKIFLAKNVSVHLLEQLIGTIVFGLLYHMQPSIIVLYNRNCWWQSKVFEFQVKLFLFLSNLWKILHGGSANPVLLPIVLRPSENQIQLWIFIQMQI